MNDVPALTKSPHRFRECKSFTHKISQSLPTSSICACKACKQDNLIPQYILDVGQSWRDVDLKSWTSNLDILLVAFGHHGRMNLLLIY